MSIRLDLDGRLLFALQGGFMLWIIISFLLLSPIACAILRASWLDKRRPDRKRGAVGFVATILVVAALEALIVCGFIYYVLTGLSELNRY